MSWFNSNSIHNLFNFAVQAIGYGGAFLKATGCVDIDPGPEESLDCTRSFLPETMAYLAVGAIGTAKTIINLGRDGIGGLWKPQPPVVTTLPVIPVTTTPDDAHVKIEYKSEGEKTKTKEHVY